MQSLLKCAVSVIAATSYGNLHSDRKHHLKAITSMHEPSELQNDWRRLTRIDTLVRSTLLVLALSLLISATFGTLLVGGTKTYWFWVTTAQLIVALAGISAHFWLLPAWRRKLATRTLDAAIQRLSDLGI